jgi:hypothetical protein
MAPQLLKTNYKNLRAILEYLHLTSFETSIGFRAQKINPTKNHQFITSPNHGINCVKHSIEFILQVVQIECFSLLTILIKLKL